MLSPWQAKAGTPEILHPPHKVINCHFGFAAQQASDDDSQVDGLEGLLVSQYPEAY